MALVEYQVKDRIAFITLNRPDKRNALNGEVVHQLLKAFERAASDTRAKVVVLKANGTVFSAGADLAYLRDLQKYSYQENLEDSARLGKLLYVINTHDKVVIAQVQGDAIAGGCGLATVCDFVFTHPEVRFGYTEVRIGFIPALVMVFLLRRIGEGPARELLLTGRLIASEQALQWGLVNRVVPTTELETAVISFAQQLITENSSQSLQRTKSMISRIGGMTLKEALDYASQQNAQARETKDCQEGIQAFLDKRQKKW